jgi:hypothetical protein
MSLVPVERLLTPSRAKSYSACPRKHHYAYTLGVRSASNGSAATRFGTAAHAAIEAYWRERAAGADLAVDDDGHTLLWPSVNGALADHFDALGEEQWVKLRALIELYCASWNERAVEVLAVEREFQMPLLHPRSRKQHPYYWLGGKIDLLVRLEDGRVALIDHKTTSSDPGAGSDYRRRLLLDPQPTIYVAGCETFGHSVDLILYDVLVKPGQERLLATPTEKRKYTKDGKLYASQREHDESADDFDQRIRTAVFGAPADYFVSFEVPKPAAELNAVQANLWAIASELLRVAELGFARQNAGACFDYGGCEYLPVCTREASIDDARLYVRVGPSPELTEAARTAA